MCSLATLSQKLDDVNPVVQYGLVTKLVGLVIESRGPKASMGELCLVSSKHNPERFAAEVVGFNDGKTLLMPIHSPDGIYPGATVKACGKSLDVAVGEGLLGRVVDGLGNPLDGMPNPSNVDYYPLHASPPQPLSRPRITEPLMLGVKAVDGLLTMGKGQRLGIFAGSGVGKSTLLGMIARNTRAEVNVIGLVGERGREVREFIERDLGPEGLARSVVVVATSDQPPLVRMKAAFTATAIAEFFRDRGADVLLMMDSVTRFAMAQREVGLAVGEPPATRGYPPSVFASLPKLLERAGTSEKGTISALYAVLVDGDDHNEPIADAVRGILDGHVVLSRDLAAKNHFPAINVLGSISRVMNDVVTEEHKRTARRLREVLATYERARDLIEIGAYTTGANAAIDHAIEKIGAGERFLRQETSENYSLDDTLKCLGEIFN